MSDQALACNIHAIELEERPRHFQLGERWRAAVQEVVELPAGYAFRFPPETALLLNLAEFVSRERYCCPFFQFEIVVEPEGGPFWLRLLGEKEVKEFVRATLVAAPAPGSTI